MKKLVSILITLALISGMLICVPASAAGNSAEIFNFNFEDGVAVPSFNYGGTTYNVQEFHATGYKSVESSKFGRLGNKSLFLNPTSFNNSSGKQALGIDIPEISGLEDVGGGTLVASWDLAIDALAGGNEIKHQFNVVKKNTADGTYASQTINVYFNSSTASAINFLVHVLAVTISRQTCLEKFVLTILSEPSEALFITRSAHSQALHFF